MRRTMSISMPESMFRYIKRREAEDQFGSVSEYFRELVRLDQKRTRAMNQSVARQDFLRRTQLSPLSVDLSERDGRK